MQHSCHSNWTVLHVVPIPAIQVHTAHSLGPKPAGAATESSMLREGEGICGLEAGLQTGCS